MSKPFFIAGTNRNQPRTAEVIDVAARYLVYKLYDATSGEAGAWQILSKIGERRLWVHALILFNLAMWVGFGWIVLLVLRSL